MNFHTLARRNSAWRNEAGSRTFELPDFFSLPPVKKLQNSLSLGTLRFYRHATKLISINVAWSASKPLLCYLILFRFFFLHLPRRTDESLKFLLKSTLFAHYWLFTHYYTAQMCCSIGYYSARNMCQKTVKKLYHPREPEKSPFFQLVSSHFDEFERFYPEKYQKTYGFWRPVIRRSIDKFIKCGDLREGFARVKCNGCGKEMIVPYSCRQRCCCPSCHQKRVLLLAYHLGDEVIAPVDHRQFVFTIPKRFRIYFRYSRKLLGKLSLAAWETVREVFVEECDCEEAVPAMISGIQTFGDLIDPS